jgi:8-oxo-dGTP pyrophosphatase MutT (NUDIX family)
MKNDDITWKAFGSYRPRSHKVYGIIAISKENRVLLVKGRERNKWSFPKGHYKGREGELDCALRECYEETGICFRNIIHDHYRKLSSGCYYIYTGLDEFDPIIQDCNEICDVAWVSIPSMYTLKNNVDVNKFLDVHKTYINN